MPSPDDRTILVSPKRPAGQSSPQPKPRPTPPPPATPAPTGRSGGPQPPLASRASQGNLTGLLLLTGIIGAAFGISFAITLRWSNPQLAGPGLFGRLQLFSPKDFPGQKLENATFQGAEGTFERPGGEGSAPSPASVEPPVMHEEPLPRAEAPPETPPSTDAQATDLPPTASQPAPVTESEVAEPQGAGPVESEPLPPAVAAQEPTVSPTAPEPTAPVAPPAE